MFMVISRRLAQSLVTIAGVVVLVFLLFSVIPGSYATALGGEKREINAETMAKISADLKLDQPLHQRFASYVSGLVTGDLGTSFALKRPVTEVLAERIPASFKLACAAIAFAVCLGLPLGFLAAVRQGTWMDTGAMMLAVSGLSVPGFWFGLLMMYVMSVQLKLLPTFGYGSGGIKHLILPAMALGIAPMALLARTTRAAVLETLNADFVRTARSKGNSELRIALRHVARNAFVLILTTIGLQFGSMLGGSVVIENLFSWPGLGAALTNAVKFRDIPMVQGTILLIVFFFLFVNTLVDIAYLVIDPRIRYR